MPLETPFSWLTYATIVAEVVILLFASGHAVLYKRESRSLVAWIGVIWLAPFLGAALYALFGINRIQRRARVLRSGLESGATTAAAAETPAACELRFGQLDTLAALVSRVVQQPLVGGNRIRPLENGEQAYPAMLEAMAAAQQSITLCTYIFDSDQTGLQFLDALRQAAARGVAVRLLIDDVGARYSFPTIVRRARRAGVPVASFLPVAVPWWFHYSNLRNHRKLMVVDGQVGFTGGMNIREEHRVTGGTRRPVQDLHFQIEGPVVGHLQEAFATDWYFTTGERLSGPRWFPEIAPAGDTAARGIADGPDEDFEKLRLTILGAIACAHSSLTIVTPYFLPDSALITQLNVAALRGVEVRIVLPGRTNLQLVQWASTAQLWQVLDRGCRVWRSPPPFDHTKLMIVDEAWALLGSVNWDQRSLRLNFEFNVECYDRELARQLLRLVDARIAGSREVTLAELDGRSLPVRLRDGCARIFTPYL